MAKSIRSKWKKKMRAIKRVRYGERELEKLKAILATDPSNTNTTDINISNLNEIATVTDAKTVLQEMENEVVEGCEENTEETMEVDKKRQYNSRTMKDELGRYPPWLSKKRIKQISNRNKKIKTAKRTGKKIKPGGKRRNR